MNFLDGRIEQNRLSLDSGLTRDVQLAARSDGRVALGIRPEAIGVSPDGTDDMQIKVRNFELLGSVTYIYGVFENGERLTVQMPLQCNKTIGATLPSDTFHLFDGKSGQALAIGP